MNSRYITAIDIGTSKLAAIVGEKTSAGIRIIGYCESPMPSDGVRRSEIMNPKLVIDTLKPTMQKVLEQIHSLPETENYNVRDVYVNISGQSLAFLLAEACQALPVLSSIFRREAPGLMRLWHGMRMLP